MRIGDLYSHALALLAGLLCALAAVGTAMSKKQKLAESPKPRLSDFGRVSHVTAAALSKVLEQVRDEGMPDAIAATSVRRHRSEAVDKKTRFGKLLQAIEVEGANGRPRTFWVQHPLAMLEVMVKEYPDVRELFRTMSTRELKIVLYSDEVTPGREIIGNDRKVQNIFWSILNFGPSLLVNEDFWFTIASLRSSECKRIAGGMQQVYTRLLKLFFGKPTGPDLRDGVFLDLGDDEELITGYLAMLLQDERAGKEAAGYKGASGVKLCLCCRTTCLHTAKVLRSNPEGLLPSTCTDPGEFQLHTAHTLAAIVRRLHEVALSGDRKLLDKLETDHGFNYSPHWMLLDPDLAVNLAECWMWDWFHCYLADGIFNVECDATLHELGAHDLGVATLDPYLSMWTWPRAYASAKKVCRHLDGTLRSKISGSASEMLSLRPVLEKYFVDIVQPAAVCRRAVQSMLLLLNVLSLLSCTLSGAVDPEELERAMIRHFQAQQRAWRYSLWLPKSHYALHLGRMLARFGMLLATFVQERKHRVVKRFAEPRMNTTNMEKGLMEEITLQHLHDLHMPKSEVLLNPHKADKAHATAVQRALRQEDSEVLVSNTATCFDKRVTSQDVVLFEWHGSLVAGKVYFHAAVDGVAWTCVSPWGATDREDKWRVLDQPRMIRTASITESVIYSAAQVGQIATIIRVSGDREFRRGSARKSAGHISRVASRA